ncbi:MAG: septal ring lytic transglycosylase RlpA family protein, partial [Thermoanaerobaculia bacterium]
MTAAAAVRSPGHRLLVLAALLLATGCATAPASRPGHRERGIASWYGPGFHGRQTANGETYDMYAMTAAHKSLPFDTVVEVRNLDNGRRTEVRINDRGPFVRGRIIDLSRAAAEALDMIGSGVARVEITLVRHRPKAARRTGTAGGRWLVQSGAFSDRSRASDRARRLRGYAGDPRVVTEGGLHKVVLGPWQRQHEAEGVAARLRRDGFEAYARRA